MGQNNMLCTNNIQITTSIYYKLNSIFASCNSLNSSIMIIGVPREIKNNENRVALTPAGAKEFCKRGHEVYVQDNAGIDSGFLNEDYESTGAKILPTIEEVYSKAEMIIKVKEPIETEYPLIRKGQLLFTYFHFASYRPLTEAMIESKACRY